MHFTHQRLNRKQRQGKKIKRKEETEKRCDAYLGASSDGVWKDEESILSHLLVPGEQGPVTCI
jgi:hypothetical protein